ncbi:flagellar motor protein MotB [Sphingosinicella soli]|uniref:Chemotaxis protein MotB n=1 Tax=Sphingosinicella soli TaxID=333708 RepID=A0A7W7B2N6_9SPHN|nr:flagellar motor protein MotB [Sphingosinicella soli]MBB4632848.1 chemotaxis protein MotB [Sphingosinicella soli]
MSAVPIKPLVAAAEVPPPIIIKKITIEAHAGHHGGAWKVAYADFVTAMMAFFLLLWIVGATNEDQRKGIADYFSPTLVQHTKAGGSNGVMGGRAMMSPDGNAPNATPKGSQRLMPVTSFARVAPPTPEERAQADQLRKEDVARFEAAAEALEKRMASDRNLAQLRDQLRLSVTPEGLRIDILDEADFAMFALGTDRMSRQAQDLVRAVSSAVQTMPNPIAMRGHTDSLPFAGGSLGAAPGGMNNWVLSAQRAEATRAALAASGVDPTRFSRLEGVADREPFNSANPYDPRNRRISVTLLYRTPTPAAAAPTAQ